MSFKIPEAELDVKSARSSGAGGQNVNKRDTKAIVSWDFMNSPSLNEVQKEKILTRVPKRFINADGHLQAASHRQRSKEQNKKRAIEVMQEQVDKAFHEDPERIETRVSKRIKAKRKDIKQRHSRKKKERSQRWA